MDGSVVAFLVSDSAQTTYSAGERIRYSKVVTNEGAGFMPGQNEFLCPVTGMCSHYS